MKEEYMGYGPGDRLRMVHCTDPYSPIPPGLKGTVKFVDDMNTLHMRWQDGRTLGVVLGEDEVERIPIDEEYRRLDAKSAVECPDEEAFDAHRERALEAIGKLEDAVMEFGGAWAVRITRLDVASRGRMPEFAFVEAGGLGSLLDGADVKNGVDVGFHKAENFHSFVMVAHGTAYDAPRVGDHVREAFECRLLKSEVAADYRERMDAGWSDRGEGPRSMFFSRGDQQSLSAERRKLLDQDKGKSRDVER